jgi:hypothetical protein
MANRNQLSEILNRFFVGYQSSISIELLANAMDLHYEGLSDESKKMFVKGMSQLGSRCG